MLTTIDYETLHLAYIEQVGTNRYAAILRDGDDLEEGRISMEVYGATQDQAAANAEDILRRMRLPESEPTKPEAK